MRGNKAAAPLLPNVVVDNEVPKGRGSRAAFPEATDRTLADGVRPVDEGSRSSGEMGSGSPDNDAEEYALPVYLKAGYPGSMECLLTVTGQ